MLVLKGCNRCHGDLYVERQMGTADLVCLQCGYRRSLRVPEAAVARNAARLRVS
jgi:DNA-directed RNA polymerase subunit RPC12/RpoP